jgi:hypothetical protein
MDASRDVGGLCCQAFAVKIKLLLLAAEIYEAFANESMPCDEPWPKKGAWRSSSD